MPIPAELLLRLIGSGIGDATPQLNPTFDPQTYDPNDSAQQNVNPYSTPGFGTKFFHPEVASQEAAYNNAWKLMAPEARQKAAAQLAGTSQLLSPVYGQDATRQASAQFALPDQINRIRQAAQFGSIGGPEATANSQLQETLLGGRNASADLMQNNPDRAALMRGSSYDYNNAQYKAGMPNIPLAASLETKNLTGALGRVGNVNQALDAEAVNRLSQATGVDSQRIELARQQLAGELQREPTEEEIKGILLGAKKSEANIQAGTSKTQEEMLPIGLEAMKNRARFEGFASHYHPPLDYRLGYKVGENGIEPLAIVPGGMSAKIAEIEAIKPGSVSSIMKGSPASLGQMPTFKGAPITTPLPMKSNRFDSMTGEPVQEPSAKITPSIGSSMMQGAAMQGAIPHNRLDENQSTDLKTLSEKWMELKQKPNKTPEEFEMMTNIFNKIKSY